MNGPPWKLRKFWLLLLTVAICSVMAMMASPVAAKDQPVGPTPISGGSVILTISWQSQFADSSLDAQSALVPGNRIQLELGRNLVVVLSTNGAEYRNFKGGSLTLYSAVFSTQNGTTQANQLTTGALNANADSPMSLHYSFSATNIVDSSIRMNTGQTLGMNLNWTADG